MRIQKRKRQLPAAVHTVNGSLRCGEQMKRSIAVMRVISQIASEKVLRMENLSKVRAYLESMAQMRHMRKKGLISLENMIQIEQKLADKYGLNQRNIYRDIDLLSLEYRGNMPYYKGR